MGEQCSSHIFSSPLSRCEGTMLCNQAGAEISSCLHSPRNLHVLRPCILAGLKRGNTTSKSNMFPASAFPPRAFAFFIFNSCAICICVYLCVYMFMCVSTSEHVPWSVFGDFKENCGCQGLLLVATVYSTLAGLQVARDSFSFVCLPSHFGRTEIIKVYVLPC